MLRLLMLSALLSAAALSPCHAQHMYRCGKTFQDRPCENGEGQVIGSTGSHAAQSAVSDYYCSQQGKAAAQIRWQKEAGKTEAEQLAQNAPNPDFIRYVYAKKGAAEDVRKEVEADCMATRHPLPGAPIQAAMPTADITEKPSVNAQGGSAGIDASSAAQSSRNAATCDQLHQSEQSIQAQQRKGGSAATMESLDQQLRQQRERIRKAGC